MSYILDSSAIIAYLGDEKGADFVLGTLKDSSIPFIALSEIYYVVWKKKSRAEANKIYGIVKKWELPILFPSERIILTAGRFKAVHNLGIADSYIASFSFDTGFPLITKDEDFNVLRNEIDVLLIHKM